jgi:hypothetical protein
MKPPGNNRDLKELGCEDMDWTSSGQGKRQAFVDQVMNLHILWQQNPDVQHS